MKLVDEVAKRFAREALDETLDINKTNIARGGHKALLSLYRWLRTLYDEAHTK